MNILENSASACLMKAQTDVEERSTGP